MRYLEFPLAFILFFFQSKFFIKRCLYKHQWNIVSAIANWPCCSTFDILSSVQKLGRLVCVHRSPEFNWNFKKVVSKDVFKINYCGRHQPTFAPVLILININGIYIRNFIFEMNLICKWNSYLHWKKRSWIHKTNPWIIKRFEINKYDYVIIKRINAVTPTRCRNL